MAEPVRQLLVTRHGIDAPVHSATQVTRDLVRSARVIVTATRAHRVHIVSLVPDAAGRTFTLKELARTASGGTFEGLDALVAAAREAAATETRDFADDLDDPYGLEEADYVQMAEEADKAIGAITASISR